MNKGKFKYSAQETRASQLGIPTYKSDDLNAGRRIYY